MTDKTITLPFCDTPLRIRDDRSPDTRNVLSLVSAVEGQPDFTLTVNGKTYRTYRLGLERTYHGSVYLETPYGTDLTDSAYRKVLAEVEHLAEDYQPLTRDECVEYAMGQIEGRITSAVREGQREVRRMVGRDVPDLTSAELERVNRIIRETLAALAAED